MGSSGMASSPGAWIGAERGGKAMSGSSSSSSSSHNKITKGRRMVVKPILKKLSSNSEKNSLDLDRVWEEQQYWTESGSGTTSPAGGVSRSARDVTFLASSLTDLSGGGGSSSGGVAGSPGTIATVGSACGGSGDGSSMARPIFQHARSPSGASHASAGTAGSSGPGGRSGSFVHPFQQTPRTATPPLSFDAPNPLLGVGGGGARDYSPTITENEDDDGADDAYSLPLRRPPSISHLVRSRRPSLTSQRTSSFSDANSPVVSAMTPTPGGSGSGNGSGSGSGSGGGGGVRTNTSRSAGAASASRLVHGGSMLSSSRSQSDLHLTLSINTAAASAAVTASSTASDGANSLPSRPHFLHTPYSPSGRSSSIQSSSAATAATATITINAGPASASSFGVVASPTSSFSATPMSPLRTSLEMVAGSLAPRLRSLSEQADRPKNMVNPAEHARMMHERRAKFDEKERLKNEKLARKRGRKDAERQQRHAAAAAARSFASTTTSSTDYLPRPSTAASTSHYSIVSGGDWRRMYNNNNGGSGGPGSFMPASNATPSGERQQHRQQHHHHNEKAAAGDAEGGGGGRPQPRRRTSSSAKRKTHGCWTSVMLWIRTKLFKLSRAD